MSEGLENCIAENRCDFNQDNKTGWNVLDFELLVQKRFSGLPTGFGKRFRFFWVIQFWTHRTYNIRLLYIILPGDANFLHGRHVVWFGMQRVSQWSEVNSIANIIYEWYLYMHFLEHFCQRPRQCVYIRPLQTRWRVSCIVVYYVFFIKKK